MFAVNSERLNHTITFSADNEIHQQRVFLGWQTPALIQVWMMSSIHYVMIKSLLPTSHPSVTSLLWTRHSSRLVSAGRLRTGRHIPATQLSSPRNWGMMGKDPVTRQATGHTRWPCCFCRWREAKTRHKKRKVLVFFLVCIQMKKIKFSNIKVFKVKKFYEKKKKIRLQYQNNGDEWWR